MGQADEDAADRSDGPRAQPAVTRSPPPVGGTARSVALRTGDEGLCVRPLRLRGTPPVGTRALGLHGPSPCGPRGAGDLDGGLLPEPPAQTNDSSKPIRQTPWIEIAFGLAMGVAPGKKGI